MKPAFIYALVEKWVSNRINDLVDDPMIQLWHSVVRFLWAHFSSIRLKIYVIEMAQLREWALSQKHNICRQSGLEPLKL